MSVPKNRACRLDFSVSDPTLPAQKVVDGVRRSLVSLGVPVSIVAKGKDSPSLRFGVKILDRIQVSNMEPLTDLLEACRTFAHLVPAI